MKNANENVSFAALVNKISQQYGVSEKTVKLVMRGLKEVLIKEVAKNNAVSLRGLGHFYLVKGKPNNGNYLCKKYETCKRKSFDYPRFQCSQEFRNNVQAENGNAPDYYYKNQKLKND